LGPTGVGDLECLPTEDVGEFVADDLDDLLARIERLRQLETHGLLADSFDNGAGDSDVDVGLKQRRADLAQDLVDIAVGQAAFAAQLLEDAIKTIGQCVKHARSG